MEAVREILQAEGTSVEEMDVNENLEYESELYHDLVIEKIGEDRLSVGDVVELDGTYYQAKSIGFDEIQVGDQ